LTGNENARINLWIVRGSPPSNRRSTEVVISSFGFAPAGL
jgi:hypothetical protein